jgi:serine/threonine-protein kinase
VLFEMLTGSMPFSDESPLKLMLEVVQADIPDVRALNAEVDAETARILARMLAKEPSARYQNAHELIEDLARHPSLLQGGALSFKPASAQGPAATLVAVSTPASTSARSRSSTLPPVVASGATVHRERGQAAPPSPSMMRRQWPLWSGAGLLAIAASLGWVFRDALFDQTSPGTESVERAEQAPVDSTTTAETANAGSDPLQSPIGAMPPGAEDRRGRLRGALTERMQDPAARPLTAPIGFHTFAVEGIGDPALILPAKRRIEEAFVAAGLEKTPNLLRADVVIVVRADAVETQESAQTRAGAPVSVDFSVRPFSRGRAIDPGFEQKIRYTAINAESKVERVLDDQLAELIKDLQE